MSSLQPVRGTRDLLPEEMRRHRMVEEHARTVAALYGFEEMATPVFEFTEVFARTLGDTSDIVTKEMYTFEDRSGERLTLRPEGTAGVARAFISNGLAQQTPLKLFYRGPMFRYERPQKGRQRQFHQVGVELLGIESPQADIEVIAMAHHMLSTMGLSGGLSLELNSLGDGESRAAYRDALVAYLRGHRASLSSDSRERLERNPLRILDSKDAGDREVLRDAPLLTDYLNESSRAFLDTLCDGLTKLDVPVVLNPQLVRGLDYYCHTAFEFTTNALGAQGTVLAGGRYDGLIEQMGGPRTPGIGWAAGVERLAMLLAEPVPAPRPIAVVPASPAFQDQALTLTQALRAAGLACDLGFSGNLAKRMKRANKLNARHAVILAETEAARGCAVVRDLDTGEQREVSVSDIVARFLRAG